VSWITTEDVDRDKEVVLSKGMDDSHFKLNPIVTLQHCYQMPPVGKSVWRKKATDGNMRGIKAKTQYLKKPDSLPQDSDWPPDVSFTLVQSGRVNRRKLTDRGAGRSVPTGLALLERRLVYLATSWSRSLASTGASPVASRKRGRLPYEQGRGNPLHAEAGCARAVR